MEQPTAHELRVALTVANIESSAAFYRQILGLEVIKEWSTETGRGVVLAAGRATLELIDQRQAETIDMVEVGRRVSGPVRLAIEFANVDTAVLHAIEAGAELLHAPTMTPWGDRNARLIAPDGMQLTFFQLLNTEETE